ncbi:GntG family PLP-dependent aldolase, partial [Desulfococcus sp.]|uniref:GntG family PLP-dependent aldolase n=1 Tax=Desulfococcus sp. TaxID=2025834 RepID=UPI003593D16B
MQVIELRSDTLTRPTDAMRKAMAEARVGDDVFGEDPTVNRLEEMAAARVGKAAALFVASGTMGNLVAQLTHCGRGSETILGDESHVFYYEQGGAAALGGIHPRTIPNRPDGTLAVEEIAAAVRPDDNHFPRSRLILLENTHNRCGGAPLTPAYTAAVGRLARDRGLSLHVDGARIFNAAAALGVDVRELTAPADSVSFCLSKGLGAPVGSVLCGGKDFIAEAQRNRKVLGGG